MGREWVRRPLAELGEIVTGTTPPSSEPDLFGQVYAFLTPSDMTYDARHVATERFLSKEGGSRFESRMLPAGSVSVVCIGATIGKVAMTQVATLTNQQINSIVVDSENHHPDFTYYLLRQYAPEIRQHAGGAATPILNKTAFSRIELPIPPLPVQREIAAVLAGYDELIENNLRRIEVLEEMAQAVYREWFVNFRFPGHEDVPLVDSPPGRIPEGWERRPLFDAAEVAFGFAFKSNRFAEAGPMKVVRIRDIPVGDSSTFTTEIVDARYAVGDGDVLIGMDGDFHMCVWAAGDAWLNQRVTRVRPKADLCVGYVYEALRQPISEFNEAIVGTTVAHLGKRHLETISLVVPPDEIRTLLRSTFDPITGLVRNLKKQVRNLRDTRDLLLPRLVSGSIDVSDLDIGTEWLAS
jgi:type I restriction enzyme S subunit